MSNKVLLLTAMKDGKPFAGSAHEAGMVAGCERMNAATGGGPRYVTAAINELAIGVTDGVVSVRDLRNNCSLNDYAFVLFRGVLFARDHFMAVARYLEKHAIPFADAHDVQGTVFGKIGQMVDFALQGVPVPDSMALWSGSAYQQLARQTFALPFILKANHGIKGRRNYLVTSWDMLDDLLEQYGSEGYIAQPFIPNEGDYRVLYLGERRLIFYRQAQPGSHVNNSSQGGQGTLIEPADCDPVVLTTAEKAIAAYGRSFGGVDVLVDSTTDKPYVLEINDTPAVFAGLFQDKKVEHFAAYVKERIGN